MDLPAQSPAAFSPEKADKAQAILTGALEVFTTHGYAAASMARIAAAAGVSKPTLYSYFQDKEGLFVALIQHLTYNNSRLLSDPAVLDMSLPPDKMMRKILKSVIKNSSHNKTFIALIRLIISESEQFPQLSQAFIREVSKPMLERFALYLTMHPQLNLPDPMVTARIIAGTMVHYMITQEIMHGSEILPMDAERLVDGLIDVVMLAGGAPHLSTAAHPPA
ncbi:MAG: TetR/AcrR family transcriptional regulator [Cyanobacteria bacterium P01_A01_bin.105]